VGHGRPGAGGRRRRRGGSLSGDALDTLAVAALCGVPVERIVSGDEFERALWRAGAARASELRAQLLRAHASHVGNEVAKRFK
jgi:hypothetical protein